MRKLSRGTAAVLGVAFTASLLAGCQRREEPAPEVTTPPPVATPEPTPAPMTAPAPDMAASPASSPAWPASPASQ
jgi:hypothetical protein